MVTTSCNKCNEIIEEGQEIQHLTSCAQSLFSCKLCKKPIQVLSIGQHRCIPDIVVENVDDETEGQEEMDPVDYNVPQNLQQQQPVPDQEIRFRGPVGDVERQNERDQVNEAAPDESAPKPLNDRPLNMGDYTPPFITLYMMLFGGAVPVGKDLFGWKTPTLEHLTAVFHILTIGSMIIPRMFFLNFET